MPRVRPLSLRQLGLRMADLLSHIEPRVTAALERASPLARELLQDFEAVGLDEPARHVAQALVAKAIAVALLPAADGRALRSTCPRLERLLSFLSSLEETLTIERDLLGGVSAIPSGQDGREAVLHFYEAFLSSADRWQRTKRGVFYTPPDLAAFVVRQVDRRLPAPGLLAGDWSILDPAAGTGTFLVETFRFIQRAHAGSVSAETWPDFVGRCLAPRLGGRELLPTACVVALVRLNAALAASGYRGEPVCWNVAWTDTLTESLESWGHPARRLIIGNPPYVIDRLRTADWLAAACERMHDPVRHERNRQPLADAYVKFLTLACHLAEHSDEAALGMVVNRSCFDGRLFAGLRQRLRERFPCLAVVDLGGETRGSASPGGVDQNLFAITQGVGILLGSPGEPSLAVAREKGTREQKQAALEQDRITWQCVDLPQPGDPWSGTVRISPEIAAEYARHPALCDLIPFRSPGVKTSCDAIAFAFTRQELETQVRHAGWTWDPNRAVRATYRAGDVRWLYYDPAHLGRPRLDLAVHVLTTGTISLIAMRQSLGEFSHLAACRGLACHGTFYLGNRGQDYLFPQWLTKGSESLPNVDQTLLPDTLHSPERLFGYVSAVLLSPQYHARYGELVSQDFPRIPLTNDPALQERLIEIGREWLAWQLWLHADDPPPAGAVVASGSRAPLPSGESMFNELPEDVRHLTFGGYRALETFWKARRGRVATPEDVAQFQKLVQTLVHVRELQQRLADLDWQP